MGLGHSAVSLIHLKYVYSGIFGSNAEIFALCSKSCYVSRKFPCSKQVCREFLNLLSEVGL